MKIGIGFVSDDDGCLVGMGTKQNGLCIPVTSVTQLNNVQSGWQLYCNGT